ncbi:MAG: M20/M25/M40 family metallo-hydrolase [Pirellulales bacterium]|nr:M20/M25/M40 family metallo-hydrolase [Pirellulales bacterium]
MFSHRCWLIAVLGILLLFAAAASAESIQDIVDRVNQTTYTSFLEDQLYTHLGDDRKYGAEHDLARDFIFGTFESYGLSTTLEPFTYASSTHHNVVGIHLGTVTPERIYVVGAHYDSTNSNDAGNDPGETPGAPGADDNASGVAGVLEAARVLSQSQFESTLVFIAFDREEQGLYGSKAYVNTHSTDDVRGMISLDMIAYHPYSTGESHYREARVYYSSDNSTLTSELADALDTFGNISGMIGQFGSSDHVPFDNQGFNAALLIEYAVWSNPNYHRWSDSVDTQNYIDYAYATDMTRGVVGYLSTAAVVVSFLDSDFNQDGTVNSDDLLVWQAGFGIENGVAPVSGDANGDTNVDGHDFLIWQQQLGLESTMGSASIAIPEPASQALMVIAWIILGCLFKRV